jgi:hypothetical protein
MVLQLGRLGGTNNLPPENEIACYAMLHRASDLDGFFGMIWATKRDMLFGTWIVGNLSIRQVH